VLPGVGRQGREMPPRQDASLGAGRVYRSVCCKPRRTASVARLSTNVF